MVRLVFRPYTQVRRTICTSVSLRASTRVSSGFALLRHSSPSFGSQQVRSHSNLSQKIKVGRWCTPTRGIPPVTLLAPPWVCHPPARVHVRLLGPCYKTGRMESPERQRPERAGARSPPEGARFVPRPARRHRQATRARSCPAAPAHADQRPASSGGPAGKVVPHPTEAHPRPPSASLPAISSTL